jgi:uncharacterized membrane protein YqhA
MSDSDDRAQPPSGHRGAFEHLLRARYLAVVVVVLALLHALTFLFMGTQIAFKAYHYALTRGPVAAGERPGLELLHSLDFLLLALVLIILAFGVAKLFLRRPDASDQDSPLPSWLRIETFSDLKYLLWETILTALLIIALSTLTSGMFEELAWTGLVIPAAIFLLAVSLYFMKKA